MTARILVFAKAPIPGRAKTRLIPALGAVGAAMLQQRLTLHTLVTASRSRLPTQLWCHPDPRHPFFTACADGFGIPCRSQQGDDLGARMQYAATVALGEGVGPISHPASATDAGEIGDPVLLIGTDCPDLAAADLTTAAESLADNDAVLGPALDGGYYLLGLRRLHPSLFEGIPWGTDAVLAETRRRLAALGWRWRELASLADIDRPEDLAFLPPCLRP